MRFTAAIAICFSKIFALNGRANRSEFWFYHLFLYAVFSVFVIISIEIGQPFFSQSTTTLSLIIAFILVLSVTVRRLHDHNRTGWWVLVALADESLYAILLIYLALKGTEGPNTYGPDPLRPDT